jgi:cytochrome P450
MASDLEAAPVYYDPYDYAIDANPHPTWHRMRDEAPLYYNETLDFYALSRYQDVLDASNDIETFSSAHGTVLNMMSTSPDEMPGSILFMDPPVHDTLRRLISRGFTPRRVSLLHDGIRDYTRGLFAEVADLEAFDFVDSIAAKLPPMVIGAYLGLPPEESEERRRMTDASLHIEDGEAGMVAALKLYEDTINYYGAHVRDRMANPRDDMITDLTQAEASIDGETRKLSERECIDFLILMSSAGNETVARALGWSSVYLSRLPDQRQKLVDDPSLCKNAFEELLRYEAPSPIQGRWVNRDVEYYGTKISAGSKIMLLTGSATRDERQFTNADTFDVTRKMEGQLAFGHGIHFCLGAALAREEGKIALEETIKAMPSWEVSEIDMVHTSSVRGPSKVVVHRT